MGILDQLREEANKIQSKHQQDADLQKQKEHNYQFIILPKLQHLFSYFKELLDYLEIIKEPVKIDHYSDRYSHLDSLIQQNYRLSTDKHGGIANFDKLTEVNLRFNCVSEIPGEEFSHYTDNKIESDLEKEFLSSHKLKFSHDQHLGNTKAGAVTFTIQKNIPVLFRFSLDFDNSRIVLNIENHENFEQRTQYIRPEQIDDNYLDKLARYILRKDVDFLRMDIDDAYREQLRQQIKEQKNKHAQELKAALEKERLEQEAAQEQSLSSRLKSIIKPKKIS